MESGQKKDVNPLQKKILALHDLSGFGRSSLVPIIAVLSAGGHQCVPLPTAIFSTHTAIPELGDHRPDRRHAGHD